MRKYTDVLKFVYNFSMSKYLAFPMHTRFKQKQGKNITTELKMQTFFK